MRATSILFCALLFRATMPAQVLSPEEIRDPQMSALQRKYLAELKLIANAAAAHSFPYHFYFSRTLDLPEKEQQQSDQRSVQFDRYEGQTVLKITGNYFASYSTELMKPEERARKTYQEVMLPLLEACVTALAKAEAPQAFAFEISHHVRKKLLGVSSEGVENVVLILPKDSAQRLVAASDPKAQQTAVLEGQAFLNAVPVWFWPRSDAEIAQAEQPVGKVVQAPPAPVVLARLTKDVVIPDRIAQVPAGILAKQPAPVIASLNEPPSRDTSPTAVKNLQSSYQADLDRMVQELNSQAHFVRYAPPAFIPFHGGLYLQLSVITTLPKTAAGSQYRLAALAFDQHIAHLIRPVIEYFKAHEGFDGIDFSTSVKLAGDADGSPVAVEFIFPLSLLRTYAQFDSTGQQLIDASFVLINGERVSLNLQMAEAGLWVPASSLAWEAHYSLSAKVSMLKTASPLTNQGVPPAHRGDDVAVEFERYAPATASPHSAIIELFGPHDRRPRFDQCVFVRRDSAVLEDGSFPLSVGSGATNDYQPAGNLSAPLG